MRLTLPCKAHCAGKCGLVIPVSSVCSGLVYARTVYLLESSSPSTPGHPDLLEPSVMRSESTPAYSAPLPGFVLEADLLCRPILFILSAVLWFRIFYNGISWFV